MDTDFTIKIEYRKDRDNPGQVFTAMAQYIDAYTALGQVLTKAQGVDDLFYFELNDIDKSSIISRLRVAGKKLTADTVEAVMKAAHAQAGLIDAEGTTETEEQVEAQARQLETVLEEQQSDGLGVSINLRDYAKALEKLSAANQQLQSGEHASISIDRDSRDNYTLLNPEWRFTGKAHKMFQEVRDSYTKTDYLTVIKSYNEGHAAWSVRSRVFKKKFHLTIADKAWLKRYQEALVPAIGPKDIMEARVEYRYTKSRRTGKFLRLIQGSVKRVHGIERNGQHEHNQGGLQLETD